MPKLFDRKVQFDEKPLELYTPKELEKLGLSISTASFLSTHELVIRTERHSVLHSIMAAIYMAGATRINAGKAFDYDFMQSTSSPHFSLQFILDRMPQAIERGRLKGLLQAALIGEVALLRMPPAKIVELFNQVIFEQPVFTTLPFNTIELPNGSLVHEHFAGELLAWYIKSNPQDFASSHIEKAKAVLAKMRLLLAEVLVYFDSEIVSDKVTKEFHYVPHESLGLEKTVDEYMAELFNKACFRGFVESLGEKLVKNYLESTHAHTL